MSIDIKKILEQIAQLSIPEEKKQEIKLEAEGLAERVEEFNQKYSGRTDEEAVSKSKNLENQIDSFMQKGYETIKSFGEALKKEVRKEEEKGLIIFADTCFLDRAFAYIWKEKSGIIARFQYGNKEYRLDVKDDTIYKICKEGQIYKEDELIFNYKKAINKPNTKKETFALLFEHDSNVYAAVCELGGKTYLFRIFPNQELIMQEESSVNTFTWHNNELYFVNNGNEGNEIFKKDKKIAQRKYNVCKLESFAGKLYDCGSYGVCEISDRYGERPLITEPCLELCAHNEGLYGTRKNDTGGFGLEVYDTVTQKSTKPIEKYYSAVYSTTPRLYSTRKRLITSICTGGKNSKYNSKYEGVIYEHKLIDVLTGEELARIDRDEQKSSLPKDIEQISNKTIDKLLGFSK